MAKKKQSRRVPRSSTPRMYGNGKPSQAAAPAERKDQPVERKGQPGGAAPVVKSAGLWSAGRTDSSPAALAKEYHYVFADLRRLGILAAATFAVLIALGLIVR
ncbi:MAG: hypothetical protein CVU38_05210 [Chloroflexi bacterium HGW-Chloroflexi-1]|nr:MAG: hypothetical protein CVU38_05210 [Chloroflexi bacterium HGW-Chloroflexi-1]